MFEPIDFDGYHGLNINFGPNGQDILSNIFNKSKLETPHKTTFWLLLQKKKKQPFGFCLVQPKLAHEAE